MMNEYTFMGSNSVIFSLSGQSPGRAVVLPPALASALAAALAKCLSFYVKIFYVMGKALSGELSCPCDRSWYFSSHLIRGQLLEKRICSHRSKFFTLKVDLIFERLCPPDK